MDELLKFRNELNRLDEELMRVLGRRYAVCRQVARHKREHGIPMMQPGRVAEVKERCARLAIEQAMDPDFARRLYGLIIDEACRMEDEIIGDAAPQPAVSGS